MMSESEEHGSLLEKINDKIHEYKHSSSSSDSDEDKRSKKSKKKKLFGRKHPLHHVLGGGKGIYQGAEGFNFPLKFLDLRNATAKLTLAIMAVLLLLPLRI